MEAFIKAYRQRLTAVVLALLAVLCFVTACGGGEKAELSEEQSAVADSSAKEQQKAGYGVYVDDAFVAALDNIEGAKKAIDDITAALVDVYGAPDGLHSLKNDVRFVKGDYDKTAFTNTDGLKELLGEVGSVYNFKLADIYGNAISTKLELLTTASEYLDQGIEYKTNTTKTDALAVGESVTVIEGKEGILREAYGLTYVNGMLTEKVLQNAVIVAEPVDAVVWEGSENSASLMAVDEKFTIPYDGRVSSWYGPRSLFGGNFHNGIDIIAHVGNCYGHEINAAADGVVVFSDWHSGYGLKVVIDHGDGLSTLYAHCSKSLVSVGDIVLKGQPVALIGTTGRVTGPHLHFGVMQDGVEVNPEPYIDWSTYNGSK
ncbi:MAG: peptidoglycan DD-metalloendopeptidase family protein [Clostridia bacterium]|nr:peptidoglycan DD-metalloendopeptidase family protein [Clostridia bacterium]